MNCIQDSAPMCNTEKAEIAWHVFAALSQYHAQNTELPTSFGQRVLDAHEAFKAEFTK